MKLLVAFIFAIILYVVQVSFLAVLNFNFDLETTNKAILFDQLVISHLISFLISFICFSILALRKVDDPYRRGVLAALFTHIISYAVSGWHIGLEVPISDFIGGFFITLLAMVGGTKLVLFFRKKPCGNQSSL